MSDQQPIFGPRQAMPMDALFDQVERISLDQLEAMLDPQQKASIDLTAESVAPIALALAMSADGRAFLEWLCDLTVRRPFSVTGMSIEQTALYAKQREGQNAVVFSILKAIREGEAQLEKARKRS